MVKSKTISSFKAKKSDDSNFWRRWLANKRIFSLIALIFLLLILVPLAKSYSRKRLVEQEIADIQREISDFEAKNKELQEMIIYLQSDQSLEEQARLNMGLKLPGETVAVIQDGPKNVSATTTEKNIFLPNWQKWWQYFIN